MASDFLRPPPHFSAAMQQEELHEVGVGADQVADANGFPQYTRGHWRPSEDEKLRELVAQHGPQNWNLIAQHLEGRSGKSCRLRWFNQLDPRINRAAFSEEEEGRLVAAHRLYGNKWACIARLFPGRTDNAVKNHWHVIVARHCRQAQQQQQQPHPQQQQPPCASSNTSNNYDKYTSCRPPSSTSGSGSRQMRPALILHTTTNIASSQPQSFRLSVGERKDLKQRIENLWFPTAQKRPEIGEKINQMDNKVLEKEACRKLYTYSKNLSCLNSSTIFHCQQQRVSKQNHIISEETQQDDANHLLNDVPFIDFLGVGHL